MKTIVPLFVATFALLARSASADINEFTVKLSPELASLWYEAPGLAGGSLDCAEGANLCAFGLEMEMHFFVDANGLAKAIVTDVVLHGNDVAMAKQPGFRESLQDSAAALFTDADFAVERGPELHATKLVATFAMSDPLRLEFDRAKLVSMSGGPDYRPVDGAKYSFSYAVPEPDAMGLAVVTSMLMVGCRASRRIRPSGRSNASC